jgi:hypothetical protein
MGTQKYIQKEMKSRPRELPAAPGAPSKQRFDEGTTLSKMSHGSSVSVSNAIEARDRLAEGFEDSGQEFEINRRLSKLAARRLPSVKRVDRLEESLYWLFSAVTLAYLLLEIIGR